MIDIRPLFRTRILAGLALAGFLASAGAASAGDSAVRERIEARLKKAKLDRAGDIRVEVRNGSAILTGAVLTVDAQRAAEKTARKEAKVVDNRLRVLPEPRSDSEITEAARDAILHYTYYTVFDSVELGVENGAVLLRGSVLQPHRKAEIEARVAKVAGVRSIRNQISVQPASIFDDRLRYQLARAIYGDDRFVQYANRVDPPIRIVVDRGRVTLTGYVGSRVEQALVGHIARELSSFGVDNRVGVEGDEQEEAKRPTS